MNARTIICGDIGEGQEEWEIEPLSEPLETPAVEPAPPQREPVPV